MNSALHTDWRAVRAEFPVTERCVYLNTGWSGPSSRAVVRAMAERLEREAFDGPTTPAVRHEKALLVGSVRERIADFIGAGLDEVAIGYTTTEGVNTVLRGIGLQPGDEVIICNLEHNSIIVPSYVTRRREGVTLKIVRFASTETAAEMLGALEAAMSPRTKLLLFSHVSFNRGTRLPMRDICAMAHGANREYDLEGRFDEERASIHKFELTTHSGPVLAGLAAAIDVIAGIGMPAVEARCVELADRFVAGLQAIDGARITSPVDPSVRSGIVTFTVRDHNPGSTAAALYATAGIVTRVCNDKRVRACFSIFNDEADVDRTLEAVEQLATRGLPPGTLSEAEYKAQTLEAED